MSRLAKILQRLPYFNNPCHLYKMRNVNKSVRDATHCRPKVAMLSQLAKILQRLP